MKPERLATLAATKRERDADAAVTRLHEMFNLPASDGEPASIEDVRDVQRVIARDMAKGWKASGLTLEAWERREGLDLADGLRRDIRRLGE